MGAKPDLPRPDLQRNVLDALAEAMGEAILNCADLAVRFRRPRTAVYMAARRPEALDLIAHVRDELPQGMGRGLRIYRLRMTQVARLAAGMNEDCPA